MLRRWGGSIIYIAIAVVAVFGYYVWSEGVPWIGAEERKIGEMWCDKEDGLPGAAAGKMWTTFREPQYIDGVVYTSGEPVFLGYCGPDGRLLR